MDALQVTYVCCVCAGEDDDGDQKEEEAWRDVQSTHGGHSGFSLASVSLNIQRGQVTLITAVPDQAAGGTVRWCGVCEWVLSLSLSLMLPLLPHSAGE